VATGGSRGSTIGRLAIAVANAISVATAVNRFSILVAGLATDLVRRTDLATGLALNPVAAEPTLVAIVPTRERTSRIEVKVNAEAPMRDRLIERRMHGLLIARRTRDRRIVAAAGNTRTSPVVVAVAAAVAPWLAAAVVAAAVVAAAVVAAADGAPTSG
jgi:hypothetical protein